MYRSAPQQPAHEELAADYELPLNASSSSFTTATAGAGGGGGAATTTGRGLVVYWGSILVIAAVVVAGVAMVGGKGGCAATVCTLTSEMSTLLDRHNQYRARHGAGALAWDQQLANDASSWATQCKWQHEGRAGEGENLFASGGMAIAQAIPTAADNWYAEVSSYNFSRPAITSANGHFTQLVWKASTKLGCAAMSCDQLQGASLGSGKPVFVVCRYTQQGNVVGAESANVGSLV